MQQVDSRYHCCSAHELDLSAMMTMTSPTPAHSRRRLRTAVKRLVIELGYLEQCLSQGPSDTPLQTAAVYVDSAIDCLNEHLSR